MDEASKGIWMGGAGAPIFLFIMICIVVIISGCFVVIISGCLENNHDNRNNRDNQYILHKDISVTIFWVGEEATDENGYIPNNQSAWDSHWEEHYGGLDDPNNRIGFYPKNFTPKENPFYFALPFNDFNENGERKSNLNETICRQGCKNIWIKIIKGDKIAFAQWEDSGPFEYNDIGYIFGKEKPKNKINDNAGLDVSPAVRDYLGLKDIDNIDWQFVNFNDVPKGPWTEIITGSQISW